MAMVSIRLSDELNQSLDKMVEQGIFKDKTDAMHEAVRTMMLKYDDFQLQ